MCDLSLSVSLYIILYSILYRSLCLSSLFLIFSSSSSCSLSHLNWEEWNERKNKEMYFILQWVFKEFALLFVIPHAILRVCVCAYAILFICRVCFSYQFPSFDTSSMYIGHISVRENRISFRRRYKHTLTVVRPIGLIIWWH